MISPKLRLPEHIKVEEVDKKLIFLPLKKAHLWENGPLGLIVQDIFDFSLLTTRD